MRPPQGQRGDLPRTHISRLRLLRRLSQATQCKLAILSADAGYGKTTLLAEYVRFSNVRAEWYYLAPTDRDRTRLADGLEGCLRRLAYGQEPRGVRRTRARLTWSPSIEVLTQALLRHTARLGSEIALMILDDYQNVEGAADANLLISSFIERSPPSLHFVILSRGVPRLPVARLRAQQELCVIGEEELAFTLDETSRFLAGESGLDLDEGAVSLIQERTEGWAAGLAMVSQSIRSGRLGRVMSVLADPVASAWLVYDYLAEEVFDRQEPTIQDFLARTSVLSRMTAGACDYLLDSTSSHLTLLALEERGLFTSSVDPLRQVFRYHQLFLEFLRQKLYQRESRESVERLHLRAAQYYGQSEEWEECVHHYIKAGAPLRAATVVEAVGTRYIFSGFSQTVEHWLRALPSAVTATRPWLLCLRGRLAQMSGRYQEALPLLERALRLFQEAGDEEGQGWATNEIAYVQLRTGRLGDAIRRFDVALSLVREPGVVRSEFLMMQGMAYLEAGMLEQAAESCRESLEGLPSIDDELKRLWTQSRASRYLALVHMEMGDLGDARRMASDALQFCTAHQIGEHEEGWSLASLGAVLWACGEFHESVRVFDRALSLFGRHSANLQRFIALWLGNSLRDSGRHGEAERRYAQAGSPAADLERLFTAVLTGRGHASRAAAIDLHRQGSLSESVAVRGAAEVVLAAVLRECQEASRALDHAREAARLLKAHGHRLRLASALLHQARLEYELSRLSEARGTLAQALEIAEAHGYHHFFWWDPGLIAFLCQRALADGIHPDHAAEIATRRLDSSSVPVLAPLLQDRRAEVRRRALALVSSLPGRGSGALQDEVLAQCADGKVRNSLLRAIGDRVISAQGVHILRSKHGLSWREVEVLVEYYLRPANLPMPSGDRLRRECAERLSISENTVRCHVNNLRGKLALPTWVSGKRVLEWAEQEGILATSHGADRADPPDAEA